MGKSRSNKVKQAQHKQAGQDKKATKSEDQLPNTRKKLENDSDDDSSTVGNPKKKLLMKKNSALLDD